MIDKLLVDGHLIHNVIAGAPDPAMKTAIATIAGLGSPDPRRSISPRPRYHGDVDRTLYYNSRVVDLTGWASGVDYGDAWLTVDLLKQWLALGSDHVAVFRRTGLTFDERVTFRVAGAVQANPRGPLSRTFAWAATLFCSDPRLYADTLSTGVYDPTTASTGVGVKMPMTFPMTFTGTSTTTLKVTNGGNFRTPPVFTITGPGTPTAIDNETTGESIYFTGLSIAAGATVVVDVAARTVRLGGTTGTLRQDLIDASLTKWLELAPGMNSLRLRGVGFTAGQTQLAVSYRDARI